MRDGTRIWVGVDVHKETLSVAALRGDLERPVLEERLGPSERVLQGQLKRLRREGPLQVCYEAGGFGFVLQRKIQAWGHECVVVAPSLIPQKPGDHVKTDRRDALKLAQLHRAGLLTAVYVPTEADERTRSVVRGRRALQRDTFRVQQRILKLLQARGHFYREGHKHWTGPFLKWLTALPLAEEDRFLIDAYLGQRDVQQQLMKQVMTRVEKVAEHSRWAGPIARMQCLRGVETVTASSLAVEIVDIGRFGSARQLMGWAGLGVNESSSGERTSRGGITKSGNGEVRRLMVEAAWNNTHPPRTGDALRKRMVGQAPDVVAHALRAQQRLYATWKRLGVKSPKLAVTAMAREMLGFVYALWRAQPEDLRPRD
jgi:transposase